MRAAPSWSVVARRSNPRNASTVHNRGGLLSTTRRRVAGAMPTDAKRLARIRQQREAQGLHDLLTTEETAHALGVSESLLKHARLDGRPDLPQPIAVGPRRVYYRRGDVERWARDRANGAVYRPPNRKASR